MSWFRLDASGAFHKKVLAAGNEAYGAWCRAGQWSSDALTEGFIPTAVAHTIAPAAVWETLIAAKCGNEHGLVVPAEGGYQIHDFLKYNPSAGPTAARREALSARRAEAGRKGGKRSGETRRRAPAGAAEAIAKQPPKQNDGFASSKPQATGEQTESKIEAPIPISSSYEEEGLLRGNGDAAPPTPRSATLDDPEPLATAWPADDGEDGRFNYAAAVRYAAARTSDLDDWERGFIAGMERKFTNGGKLSANEKSRIQAIDDKLDAKDRAAEAAVPKPVYARDFGEKQERHPGLPMHSAPGCTRRIPKPVQTFDEIVAAARATQGGDV